MVADGQFKYRTVKQAVRFLGTGTHVYVPTSRDKPEALTYKAYQLVDISHLVEMMLDFPRFAVLAQPDRFRNIVTYAGAISFVASRLAKLNATQSIEFKPNLVVADTTAVGRIADTFHAYFDGELTVYLICGEGEDVHYDSFKAKTPLSVHDDDSFKLILGELDRSDIETAKTIFVMSYQHLFKSHYTTNLISIKSLSEVDRERLGLIDIEDADTLPIEDTPSKRFTPSPSKRVARSPSLVREGSKHELVPIHEPKNYLDFGIVVCEEKNEEDAEDGADDTSRDNSRRARSISALKRDSLILAVEQPILDYRHVLRYLRLGIRNVPKLPAFPDDCPLTRFYHDDFDPEIAVISKEYGARTGQKRKLESGCQPLVQMKSPTEEGESVAKLYYTKGIRWWLFSPRLLWLTARQMNFDPGLCQPVVDSIISQLILQRDDSTTL
ncbi:hypothetical protein FHL15_009651 [Xylaria flabelliformis]|uniref:Uncharacterized protein n=1 Tax=Xylaria flabelliformis TaxID=2512241 RepID=A0A553HNF0_9PEZI|nr:hypothetical protein FHL15_009651 [Xylaria flabelliformis]